MSDDDNSSAAMEEDQEEVEEDQDMEDAKSGSEEEEEEESSEESSEEEEEEEAPEEEEPEKEVDLDDIDDTDMTKEEKAELKQKRKERDAARREKTSIENEERKIENALNREERKREKEQEAIDHAVQKEAKGKAKVQAQARQKLRDESSVDMAKQEEIDKQRRYDFLMKSAGGEIFAKFFDASKNANKPFGGRGRPSKAKADEPGKRKRKTEKEEDEEMLAKGDKEENELIQFTENPAFMTGIMRDYQVRGLNWMVELDHNGLNGILADEMGLGKTIQSISLIGFIKTFKDPNSHHMVIVPKAVIKNWEREIEKFCPQLKSVLIIGTKEDRQRTIDEELLPGDWDVVITTYEVCILEKTTFKKFHWRYIIIDEAHRIKNEQSKLSLTIREFRSRNRLLITGTPLQNNLHELWALLNFILPDVFGSDAEFDKWFDTGDVTGNTEMITKLHSVLKPFMLRRLKADVEKSLLPKKEMKVYVGLSSMQREWYTKILSKEIDVLNGAGKSEKMRLLNILMQLRKDCNHPYLFDGAEAGPPYDPDLKHLVKACGKMMVLDKLLDKLETQGSRVLVFSQMTRMLDILEDYLIWKGTKYFRLDGNTDHETRQNMINSYNEDGSPYFLFMLSTRAGGLGINLYTADVVILYDSDWNPQMDLQAQDRAHRIGQKKQVRVYRLVTEGTVEERIVEKAELKLRMDALVIQSGRLADKDKKLGADEMLKMIQFGAQEMFKSKDSTITDDDIDAILDMSDKRTNESVKQLNSLGDLDSLQSFTFDTKPEKNMMEFEGQTFNNESQVGFKWIAPPKRDRKVHYGVNKYFNDIMRQEQPRAVKAPRPPKQPKVEDYQFYPPRLFELLEQEVYAFRNQVNYKVPKDSSKENWGPADEVARKAEQEKIDVTVPLSEEEIQEKADLLAEGFANWNKRDFMQFVKASEKYGRDDMDRIEQEIDTKTGDEVQKYATVFWTRYEEVANFETIMSQIKKGEEKIIRRKEIQDALRSKVSRYRQPYQQLRIQYGSNRGKNFTEEEDRFLVCMLEHIGFESDNCYERLRREVRNSPAFRFDWFIKSRTSQELQRRCGTLIQLIEKENEELEEQAKTKKKGQKRKTETPASGSKKKK